MPSDKVPVAKLRRKILKDKGVEPAPHTRRMLTIDERPDLYPKTPLMKMMELKYHLKLESVIYEGSLDDIVKLFNYEVDRSTISRWRQYIHSQIGLVFKTEVRKEKQHG